MRYLGLLERPIRQAVRWWGREQETPTVMHVTHWKAGSQWIYKILRECCPERIVKPALNCGHVTNQPVQRGLIYPTVYLTREKLATLHLPPFVRKFVVIRDPRDTLISLYFSMKVSHGVTSPLIRERRNVLRSVSLEEGLHYLIADSVEITNIIRSWLHAEDPVVRYEDLLHNDEAILERVLLGHCHLPVSRQRLIQAIHHNRFEQMTRGRKPGEEDVSAHERKGIAGDWRNYFTPAIKRAFLEHYGNILIEAGYERDDSW